MNKFSLFLIAVVFLLAATLAVVMRRSGGERPIDQEARTDSATGEFNAPSANASTATFSRDEEALIRQADEAWSQYRDGDEAAYNRQSAALDKLFAKGICWGRVDQPQVEFEYHRCDATSIQTQKSEPGSDAAACEAGDHDACMRL